MTHFRFFIALCATAMLLTLAAPDSATAQQRARTASQVRSSVRPDIRLGVFTDGGVFSAGGGAQFFVTNDIYINPMAEFVFISGATAIFISIDGAYQFATDGPIGAWAGAGLGILFATGGGGSATQAGLNLLGGVSLPIVNSSLEPYIQGKLFVSSSNTFQIALGVRF